MTSEKLELTPQNVYNLYWGEPDRLPCNWHTLEEIALIYDTDVDEINELIRSISWERRRFPQTFQKEVWDFLVNEWGLEYKIDFEYRDHIGMSVVLFNLINYNIGINVDASLTWRETRVNHYGDYLILFIPCSSRRLGIILNNFFKQYKVQKKKVRRDTEDEG